MKAAIEPRRPWRERWPQDLPVVEEVLYPANAPVDPGAMALTRTPWPDTASAPESKPAKEPCLICLCRWQWLPKHVLPRN